MAKKSTISADPLGAFLGINKPADSEQPQIDPKQPEHREHQKPPGISRPSGTGQPGPQVEPAKLAKEERRKLYRFSTEMRPDLQERLRNATFWTPGATVAGLLEEAVTELLDRLEKQRGEPFPTRSAALRSGRPLK